MSAGYKSWFLVLTYISTLLAVVKVSNLTVFIEFFKSLHRSELGLLGALKLAKSMLLLTLAN